MRPSSRIPYLFSIFRLLGRYEVMIRRTHRNGIRPGAFVTEGVADRCAVICQAVYPLPLSDIQAGILFKRRRRPSVWLYGGNLGRVVRVGARRPGSREENDGRLCRAGCFRWSFAAQLAELVFQLPYSGLCVFQRRDVFAGVGVIPAQLAFSPAQVEA